MKSTSNAVKVGGPIGLVHATLAKPETVPFGTLRVSVDRFQVRRPKACSYVKGILKQQDSTELSATLFKLVKAGTALDPIVVWLDADGERWVIDGHHRMEALVEANTPANQPVHVQRFTGTSEAEARSFAFQVNRRPHMTMDPAEGLDHYWRMLLCGETVGSVRGRADRYEVSQSTVQRMDKQKAPVLAQLDEQARSEGVPMNTVFIRVNVSVQPSHLDQDLRP